MYESRRIIMEFVICDDDRLYASQFIEQLKVLESQYDELFNCVYYDHYENFMESLRNKECDKADYSYLDYMYYGHLLESLKKYDDAVVQYEKAVKMDPTKTDLFKNISSAYEQKNDYKKAITSNPDLIIINYLIVVDYDMLEQYKNAISYYKSFTSKYKDDDDYLKYAKSRITELEPYVK